MILRYKNANDLLESNNQILTKTNMEQLLKIEHLEGLLKESNELAKKSEDYQQSSKDFENKYKDALITIENQRQAILQLTSS